MNTTMTVKVKAENIDEFYDLLRQIEKKSNELQALLDAVSSLDLDFTTEVSRGTS